MFIHGLAHSPPQGSQCLLQPWVVQDVSYYPPSDIYQSCPRVMAGSLLLLFNHDLEVSTSGKERQLVLLIVEEARCFKDDYVTVRGKVIGRAGSEAVAPDFIEVAIPTPLFSTSMRDPRSNVGLTSLKQLHLG